MFLGKGRFKNDDNEKILKVLHRHWFDIAQQFLIVFLMIAVLGTSLRFLPLILSFNANSQEWYPFLLFMESTFSLFVWLYIFFVWIDYYFDIWIITDKRIVNVEQKGLFVRAVSELKFEKIQDVTTEVKGIIPTVLNYGDVYIQTAGEKERFVFRHIGDPYGIKNIIMSLQKEREAQEEKEFGDIIKDSIKNKI
jgi:uncharacterized membrane protein YdbT with pleckstrin-like domain